MARKPSGVSGTEAPRSMSGVRLAVPPEAQPSHGTRYFSHAEIFPNSGGAIYPEGAPCPGHAQLPAGLTCHDLRADGKGGWIGRTKQ